MELEQAALVSNKGNSLIQELSNSYVGSMYYNSIKYFGNDSYNFNYPFSYQKMDLHSHLIKNPSKSFLIKVKGDSMVGAGINNADVLLVDREEEPIDNSIVVAEVNQKLVVKRLKIGYEQVMLYSENRKYSPILIQKNDEFKIWGVVRSIIKTT